MAQRCKSSEQPYTDPMLDSVPWVGKGDFVRVHGVISEKGRCVTMRVGRRKVEVRVHRRTAQITSTLESGHRETLIIHYADLEETNDVGD